MHSISQPSNERVRQAEALQTDSNSRVGAETSDLANPNSIRSAAMARQLSPIARQKPQEIRKWLDKEPPLNDMIQAFPDEWRVVRDEMEKVTAKQDRKAFEQYVDSISRGPWKGPTAPKNEQSIARAQIRQRLAVAALKRMCIVATTGVSSGRIRFNLFNGWVAQRLLFKKRLERKPVSMFWFRLIWPLLWQRRFLMVLVQPKGIYCFYSKPLIAALRDIIGDRSAIEIAAGDGTLSRFINEAGTDIVATDDYSWDEYVKFTSDVVKLDAREALREHKPQVVICSWPPAGNNFERHVFASPSVETYVVISSRHDFGTGNWADYRTQQDFEMRKDEKLSGLVLPPEGEPAVYVFERKSPA